MRAVFFDRDGIINEHAPDRNYYVKSWDEFRFMPDSKEAIARISKTDYLVIVVTNQQAVGKGIMSSSTLDEIHDKMAGEIRSAGGRIDKIYCCPHLENECDCRKPSPKMLDLAKDEFGIDLKSSWVIGDSEKDIIMGNSRECKTIYVGKNKIPQASYHSIDLNGAISQILRET